MAVSPFSRPPSSHTSTRWRSVPRSSAGTRAIAVAGLVLAAVLGALAVAHLARPLLAGADTVHLAGHRARVLGVRNWYGSYDMGAIGTAWCIDPHTQHPPDPALGYVPDGVTETNDDIRAAMAWAVARNSHGDPTAAAATTLVLHDLLARPYGDHRLDVDRLDPSALEGFGGAEAAVVAQARQIKAEALSRAHLRTPYRLTVRATPVDAGGRGEMVVSLGDAHQVAVAGAPILVDAAGAALEGGPFVVTGHDGTARVPFVATAGTNRFSALTILPDTRLAAFRPTRGPGQRVVAPRFALAEGSAAFEAARPPGEIEVHKVGDTEAYLPVTGAVFDVLPYVEGALGDPVATLEVGPTSTTPAAALPAGWYRVVERTPPPGYTTAPPEDVEVRSGERRTVVVLDTARRGSLSLSKVDALTHDLLDGARFELRYDLDADGTYERPLLEVTTEDVPTVVEDLRPGGYRLVETAAPPGYAPLEHPVDFRIEPGESTSLEIGNEGRATVRFQKVADVPEDSEDPPEADAVAHDFSGAVFVVLAGSHDGDEVARCTTGRAGRCRLPPAALTSGGRYCWEEIEAPEGWGLATPACFTAGAAGSVVRIRVLEPRPRTPPTTSTPPTTPPPSTTPPSTVPPTTTTPTTAPPSTSPPSTSPPSTSPPTTSRTPMAPPVVSSPPVRATPPLAGSPPSPARPSLPRTGASHTLLVGIGITLVGGGVVATRWAVRRRRVV